MPTIKLRPILRPACHALLALAGSGALAQGAANAVPGQTPALPAPVAAVPNDSAARDEAVLSLADLVSLVQRHNPNLRAALQGREAARAAVVTAAALPNPEIEAGSGQARARLPSAVGGNLSSWEVMQRLENPSVRSARIEGAQFGLEGSRQQVAATANDLVAQVRLKAYEWLLRGEEAEAAGEALQLLEQIRDRVRARVQSGEAPRLESIKADAEVVNARQRFEAARLQVDQAALAVNQLAAGQLPPRWRLSASLSDAPGLPSTEQLQYEAHDRNPELAQLRAEVARREALLREARASRFPGVDLRYGESREREFRQGVFSVGVRLPLLDQGRGRIDEAAAELTRARTLLVGRRTELSLQIQSATKALEVARLRVDALARGAVPEAEAALRVAQAAYRFGERGILDVLDAQRLLRTVRADLIDARFRLQAAAVELEFLAGRYAVNDTAASARP
jgi:cobalt-zinc-cadmium efflux system outer membrane protein